MRTSGELRNDFYKWLDDNPDGRVWDWMHKILKEEKSNQVEPEVMVNFAEEIDKMLKNIEEYFETPNYKNNVVEYKSYYDGAYYYLKQLKNILIMKSKIST